MPDPDAPPERGDPLDPAERVALEAARTYLADSKRDGFMPCSGDISCDWPITVIDRLVECVTTLRADLAKSKAEAGRAGASLRWIKQNCARCAADPAVESPS